MLAFRALVLAAGILFAGIAGAQDAGLKNFIDRLIASTGTLLQSGSPAQQCRWMLAWAFDVPGIARAVAGDAWNKANAQDRAEFQKAFEQAAVSGCAKFSVTENGALLTFAGVRTAENGDQLAAAHVNTQGRGERTWIWRIRGSGGAYRVTDIIVDGNSMLASERRDVSQVIASEGSLAAATQYLLKRAAR